MIKGPIFQETNMEKIRSDDENHKLSLSYTTWIKILLKWDIHYNLNIY